MTPRAWSYGLLFAGLLWAALIVAWWLIVAAQTVGVEAWHDSAVPAGAFSVVTPRTAPDVAPGQSGVPQGATRDPEPSVGPIATGTPLGDNRGGTPSSPSPRAVPRLAAEVMPSSRHASSMTGLDATPLPASSTADGGVAISGVASWYSYYPGQAAAGPALRAALGPGWRGTVVTVTANGVSVRTQLTDFMRADRLIDLDSRSFSQLAPLSQGLQEVTISW